MTEAWLLHDIEAIRKAAENPNGNHKLDLPRIRTIEDEPDPKDILFEKLKLASGLTGRRLTKFNPHERRHRVAELIDSYASLRAMPSFALLEQNIDAYLQQKTA